MQQVSAAEAAALTARNVEVDFGADLLDTEDQVLEDLSLDLVDGEVQRHNYADVHGSCRVQVLRELAWGTARVRLWQSVNGYRWNVGVYVLTTPDRELGEDPATYEVDGYDKLTLLQHPVGDTYVVNIGTGYLDAVRQAITDSGVTGLSPRFAGDAEAKTLDAPRVWVLDPDEPTSWLRVVNDLLADVGYRGLWVDGDGRYRSEPYQSPASRAPEWVLDCSDPRTNIVGEDRTHKVDEYVTTNWWRFIRDGMAAQPTEGAGLYTVDRSDGGLQVRRHVRLTAADQASLVAQGDRIVDEDTQRTQTLDLTTGPLPILGHMDVTTYRDSVLGTLKCLTRSHTMPLSGGDVHLELEVVG